MHHHLKHLENGLAAIAAWQGRWAEGPPHESMTLSEGAFAGTLAELAERLTDNYPFHHPVYAGQMLKPPHPLAMAAYAMAMQINPNNHALDGGPATAALEREAVEQVAAMVGYETHLGHLTSSGTIANLEALWIARQLHPGLPIAYSSQAHYTHGRMAEVLGLGTVVIGVDDRGRMDLDDLQAQYAQKPFGTVVVTLGTTGVGAIDPLDAVVAWARPLGVRIHVDAAYGGFYRLLADFEPPMVAEAPYVAMAEADSIVIDPHKHGLQPYGCGCVLFADPSVGRFYKHDSPYTYFTSDQLHLGEISLECSRAGAAAAAFWATLRALPLEPGRGLGPVLAACRRAAMAWAEKIAASRYLHLVMPPELDILAYFPTGAGWQASAISAETDAVFTALLTDPTDPVYVAKLLLPRALVEIRAPQVIWDQETITVLRSCLIKPEHEEVVGYLHRRVERAAAGPLAWDGGGEPGPTLPTRSRRLTGPLNLKAEWQNVIAQHFDATRPALVAELAGILATEFHPDVAMLDFEVHHPYGIGSNLGVSMYTLGRDGWLVCHDRLPEDPHWSGSRTLLPDVAYVIPPDAMDPERFRALNVAMEDTYELTGKYLIDWFAECWTAAGGKDFRLPAFIGFHDDEESFDLHRQEWVEDEARQLV